MKTQTNRSVFSFLKVLPLALAVLALLPASVQAASQVFTTKTPGTYKWTCPPDVTSVKAEVWGGGGSGGGAASTSGIKSAGGGGGGAYAAKNSIAVTPLTTYTFTIQAVATTPAPGGSGTSTGNDGSPVTFTGDSVSISANGGKGAGANHGVVVSGGLVTASADASLQGGSSGSYASNGSGGGAGASDTATGNSGSSIAVTGGATTGGTGAPGIRDGGAGGNGISAAAGNKGGSGTAPGGGGGGARSANGSGNFAGGDGGAGQIILTFTSAYPSVYYYQSGDPSLVANWKTEQAGTGTSPANFTSGLFLIPNGVTATLVANWAVAGGTVEVASGGQLTCGSFTVSGTGGGVTVDSGGTLSVASGTGIAGNITVTGTKTFSTGGNYIYTGSSAIASDTALPASVNNLTLNNAAGVTLAQAVTVNGTLTLTSGTLSSAGNLTMANAQTIVVNNTGTAGGLSGTPTFGSSVNVSYTGSSAITTGSEIPAATTVLNNLTIGNSAGVTLNAAATAKGILTFTSGKINTSSANLLTLASTATISGASSSQYIVGPLAMVYGATGPKTFPIGKTTSGLHNVSVNITAISGTPTIMVTPNAPSTWSSVAGALNTPANTTMFPTIDWNVNSSGSGNTASITVDGTGWLPVGSAQNLEVYNGSTTTYATTFSSPNYTTTTGVSLASGNNEVALGDYSASATISATAVSAFGNVPVNQMSTTTYTLSGNNLDGTAIMVTPPVGFQVSLDGSTWVANPNPMSVTYSGSTLNNTTISVRFVPTAVQAYGGNITYSGGNVSSPPTTAVSGTGTLPVDPTGFSATVASSSSINVAFTVNAKNNNVVLVYNNTGTFTTPSGAPPGVNGSFAGGTVLYNGTSSPYAHTGLTAGNYYYMAWSYDSNGNWYSPGVSANTYLKGNYYSQSSSDPGSLANWNSVRTGGGNTPLNFTSGDTFVVQGTGNGAHTMTTTAPWTVSGTGAKIQIENGGTLAANNLVTAPTLQVFGGGIVTASSAANLTGVTTLQASVGTGAVQIGSSITVQNVLVDSTVAMTVAANQTLEVQTSVVNAGTGTVTVNGTLQYDSATAWTGAGTLSVSATGTYKHNANGGTIPTATWDPASTCEIDGLTSAVCAGFGQTFGNLTWNCTAQSAGLTMANGATVKGNFNLTSSNGKTVAWGGNINASGNFVIGDTGSLDAANKSFTVTGNLTVGTGTGGKIIRNSNGTGNWSFGDLTINPGATVGTSGNSQAVGISGSLTINGTYIASTGVHTLSGSGKTINGTVSLANMTVTGTYQNNGTVTVSGALNVNSGGNLDLGTSVIAGNCTVNVNSGGGVKTASATGVGGNFSGSGVKTLSTGGNYTYNGSAPQSDALLPATVNNLTINNSGGSVTLNQATTISGVLSVLSGTLTLTGGSTAASLTFNGSTYQNSGTWGSSSSSAVPPRQDNTRFAGTGIVIVTYGPDNASIYPNFRSSGSGNWSDPTTWQVSDATLTTWYSAVSSPGSGNPVYIQSGHTVTLTGSASCSDLFISKGVTTVSATLQGIIALGGNTLSVNGTLYDYQGAVGSISTAVSGPKTGTIISMSTKSGTVSTSGSSTTLTGSSTKFTTELAVNNVLYAANGTLIGTVQSIASDTSLTLVSATTVASTTYGIGGVSSTTVVGQGTAFTSQLAVGYALYSDEAGTSLIGYVKAIASDTSLTLESAKTQASTSFYASVAALAGNYSIYPFTASTGGKVSIVGNSRNLTVPNNWNATLSTPATGAFPLSIDLNSGAIATLNGNLKFSSLVVNSGTLDAGGGRLAPDNGTVGQGDVTINNGGILKSSAAGTGGGSQVMAQGTGSINVRGGTLTVASGGTLILAGTTPTIDMSTNTLNGTVQYSKTANQTLVAPSGNDGSAAALTTYANLDLEGSGPKTSVASATTTVNGTLTMGGTATFAVGASGALAYGGSATLKYAGTDNPQLTTTAEFPNTGGAPNLEITNTTAGGVKLDAGKTITGTLTVDANSTLDFNGSTMTAGGVSLSSSGTLKMAVTKNGANNFTGSKLTLSAGPLTYGGTLTASLSSGGPILAGETIPLFVSSGGFGGGFSSVTAPPQAGLTADYTALQSVATGGGITYSAIPTTITVTQTSNGTIAPGTTTPVYGANQAFTITPDAGYAVATLTVDGSAVTPATSYTFNNVITTHTITATYSLIPTTITVTQTSNGTIAPGTTTPVYGANQAFTITPATGYAVATLTVDGSTVTTATSYTFNNVITTHTITATYYSFTTSPLAFTTVSNATATVSAVKMDAQANSSLGTAHAVSVSGATLGTASISAGALIYTPTNGVGTDTFTVTYSDGTGTQTMAVTVTVIAQNVGPTITPINAGGFGSFTASGIPSQSYTVQISTSLPTWTDYDTTTAAANGAINYTDTVSIAAHGNTVFYRLKQ